MAKKQKAQLSPQEKFEKQVADKCGQEVVDGINSCGPDELKAKLVNLDLHEKETQDALAEDEAVNDLKEELANAKGPYTDALAGIKLQRKLCVTRLQQKGKA
jgi:hypothetical protein